MEEGEKGCRMKGERSRLVSATFLHRVRKPSRISPLFHRKLVYSVEADCTAHEKDERS